MTAGLMDTLAGAMAVGRDRPGIDFVIRGSVGRYGLVTDQDRFDPCFFNADAEVRVGSPQTVGRTWKPNPEGVRRLRKKTRLFERLQSDMLALTTGESSFSRSLA